MDTLCANDCGFYGTKENKNLCSKCFKEEKENRERETINDALLPRKDDDTNVATVNLSEEKKKEKVTCSCCKKRIRSLMVFECRCGGNFCMKHRFPEDHCCAFDFKDHADGLVFAKDNLLIKADKLHHRI